MRISVRSAQNNSVGIVREADNLGRVVIPKELRSLLDIKWGDSLEIFTQGRKIILRKHYTSCVFCQSEFKLISFKDAVVCGQCVKEMAELA